MSLLPSVARVLAGSKLVPAEPSKNLVQISLPVESSFRRPIGWGALASERRATVFPAASVAMAATPFAAGANHPDLAAGVPSKTAPICTSDVTESWHVAV